MTTIGIDFGASHLRIAVKKDGVPILIEHPYVAQRIPFVSEATRGKEGCRNSQWQIISLKRLLDFEATFSIARQKMNSLDYLAKLLHKASVMAQEFQDISDVRCVISVPPCFSQRQRAALRTAAAQAGFSQIRLVDDTLAALLATREPISGWEHILVFSWGASTFSTGLYQAKGSCFHLFGQDGNRNLGGDDVDSFIVSLLLSGIHEKLSNIGQNVELDPVRLGQEAEKAKRLLAIGKPASIPISNLLRPDNFRVQSCSAIELPDKPFKDFIGEMVGKTMVHVEAVLKAVNCSRPDVILLTGGMTQLPDVQKALNDRFQVPLHHAAAGAVALGAVIYGSMLAETEWNTSEPKHHNNAVLTTQVTKKATNRWANHFIPFLDRAQQQNEQENDLEATINTFEKLFAGLYKFTGSLYRQMAEQYKNEKQLDKAFVLLKLANERAPLDSIVAIDYANICWEYAVRAYNKQNFELTLKNADLGATALKRIMEHNEQYAPRLAQLLHIKARALYKLRRLVEAEKVIKASVQLDPDQQQYTLDQKIMHLIIKKRPGRNDLCPCGSGKKYKKCHERW